MLVPSWVNFHSQYKLWSVKWEMWSFEVTSESESICLSNVILRRYCQLRCLSTARCLCEYTVAVHFLYEWHELWETLRKSESYFIDKILPSYSPIYIEISCIEKNWRPMTLRPLKSSWARVPKAHCQVMAVILVLVSRQGWACPLPTLVKVF